MNKMMLPNRELRTVRALHPERSRSARELSRIHRAAPRPERTLRRSVSRAVGRSMVRIGSHLAAEHLPTPARSR